MVSFQLGCNISAHVTERTPYDQTGKQSWTKLDFVWQVSIDYGDNEQRWNDMFMRMKAVIGGPKIQDRQLLKWVQRQRSCHKKDTLRPDRKAKSWTKLDLFGKAL
jgi:hypothetical protein